MRAFASNRLAYLDELENDPEVKEAISAGDTRNRFKLRTQKLNSKGRWQWDPESFQDEVANKILKFELDYGIIWGLSGSNTRMGDLIKDGGHLILKTSPTSLGNNPTDNPCIWDPKSRTLIYVDKDIYKEVIDSDSALNWLAYALDKNPGTYRMKPE